VATKITVHLKAGKFLTPNAKLDQQTVYWMVSLEIILCIAAWFLSPFVFLPKPIEVLDAYGYLWSLGLLNELTTSFILNLQAIALSALISLGMAYLYTIPIFRPIIVFVGKLRFSSMIGLTFFFTLMTRSGHELKLSLLVFSVSVFFVTGMVDVIVCIPKKQYDLARVLHMGPWKTLYEVVILGQIDKAFDVLRQNAAMGWMMLSFVEAYNRSEGGIGAMLITQNKYLHLPEVFAIQILIFLLGLGQDLGIGFMKSDLCPYSEMTTEKR
jgi:NitT/TauT family transport system permease protein